MRSSSSTIARPSRPSRRRRRISAWSSRRWIISSAAFVGPSRVLEKEGVDAGLEVVRAGHFLGGELELAAAPAEQRLQPRIVEAGDGIVADLDAQRRAVAQIEARAGLADDEEDTGLLLEREERQHRAERHILQVAAQRAPLVGVALARPRHHAVDAQHELVLAHRLADVVVDAE